MMTIDIMIMIVRNVALIIIMESINTDIIVLKKKIHIIIKVMIHMIILFMLLSFIL